MQKTHSGGTDGRRYFWHVSIKGEGKVAIRSRHATTAGVRAQLRKAGRIVTGISSVKQ